MRVAKIHLQANLKCDESFLSNEPFRCLNMQSAEIHLHFHLNVFFVLIINNDSLFVFYMNERLFLFNGFVYLAVPIIIIHALVLTLLCN